MSGWHPAGVMRGLRDPDQGHRRDQADRWGGGAAGLPGGRRRRRGGRRRPGCGDRRPGPAMRTACTLQGRAPPGASQPRSTTAPPSAARRRRRRRTDPLVG